MTRSSSPDAGMRTLLIAPGTVPSHGGIQAVSNLSWLALSELGPVEALILGEANSVHRQAVFCTQSKWQLALAAFLQHYSARCVVVQHIGLLKLLPLIRGFRGEVNLFLHGIEAWRPHGCLTRYMLHRVDHFFSNSWFTWNRFVSYHPNLGERKHTVVPLGIGSPHSGGTMELGTRSALILGRLSTGENYKGHQQLISVWPRVRSAVRGAELWVAGDGNLRPSLERLAHEVGVSGSVRFFGRVTEEEKYRLLTASRCLTMPSTGEGFGLVYLEAMRLGRPCLVSNSDAGREVVNPPEAGLAVDVTNPIALSDAVVRLLTEGEEWQRWSVAARRRYESQFTAIHFQERLKAAVTGGD